MIKRDATLTITRIPIEQLHVYEHQRRYRGQLDRYLELLEHNEVDDLGLIHVKPRDAGFEILDGHHRYCALVLSGRVDALCLVIDESGKGAACDGSPPSSTPPAPSR